MTKLTSKRTKAKSTKHVAWRDSIGTRPFTIQVEERTPGGALRVKARVSNARAWQPLATAYVLLPTGERMQIGDVRLSRGPKGDPTAISLAVVRKSCFDVYAELAAGRDPWSEVPMHTSARSESSGVRPIHPNLTLRELADLAQDVREGRFVGDTQSAQSQRWSLKTAFKEALAVLGPGHLVRTTTMADLRRIWLARAQRPDETGRDGFRTTENSISILLATIQWAADSCPALYSKIPGRWRARLRADWARCRGVTVSTKKEDDGPRYSPDEMRSLLSGIASRKGPAQVRFAADLGGEQRLGQVAELARRSNLTLEAGEHGVLVIPDSGRKHGATLHLTPSQRAHVLEEMTHGMLRHVEPLYQEGKLNDYALVPARLGADGAVEKEHALRSLKKREAQRMWRRFEAYCGVPSVKFRGWYGMRRWAADAIEDVAKAAPDLDERAKAVAQGWEENSHMSRRYQKRNAAALHEGGATLRARAREQVTRAGGDRAAG